MTKLSISNPPTPYSNGADHTDDLKNLFGSNVFNDSVMSKRLPKAVFESLRKTREEGTPLKPETAKAVALEMKKWALERGATHYTHWFQPLTGITAEKHDSFLEPQKDGTAIMEFSGTQLIKGEPDASSFPSGGLRATFEARGYTAWDCTSPAFLKSDDLGYVTLCIPTAFASYTGEALDKKTPLLRSMDAVSKQAMRVLKALGNKTAKRVSSTVGPEQEYFLIDRELFDQRLDLITTGRTLFGAPSPKGQELEDQYFGAMNDRISRYMRDLDLELWKMGIPAKTKHYEVAPAQYEMAPVFETTNMAADHNQLVMETLQTVARRHGLICLLYEKPFAGINGSGKHNNWSLATDDYENLLNPGKTPHENEQFLVFLSAVIMAVDKHSTKLRAAASNPGNDLRLGANEAPPAIISIFMGSELTEILENIAAGKETKARGQNFLTIGVDSLPPLPMDNTDRNRTSPFAFTGNRFEFRMLASSASISGCNTVLNTATAEALDELATRLEKAKDKSKEITMIVKETMNAHGRVIFNGNGYSEEWVTEAKKRGLANVKSWIESLESMNTPEAHALFEKYKVLSKRELESRYEVYIESYAKHINIEAKAAISMAGTLYIPAVVAYTGELAETVNALKAAGGDTKIQSELLGKVSSLLASSSKKLETLTKAQEAAEGEANSEHRAEAFRDKVFTAQTALRADIDQLEMLLPKDLWPVPSYADILFGL